MNDPELITTEETKAGLARYVDPSSGLDILTLGNMAPWEKE